jgi:hypothetical protein
MMSKGRIAMDGEIDGMESSLSSQADLMEGYRQMAVDVEQETEAAEWIEALISDVAFDED